MSFWQRVQKMFGGAPRKDIAQHAPPRIIDDEPEPEVPEMTVADLAAALATDAPPLMIDIREPYEWRLVRMPAARHLPMNEVPAHLDTLPRTGPIVVICAHGSRSYGVAAWLIEQGYEAVSLAGGITAWAHAGGAVEQGAP